MIINILLTGCHYLRGEAAVGGSTRELIFVFNYIETYIIKNTFLGGRRLWPKGGSRSWKIPRGSPLSHSNGRCSLIVFHLKLLLLLLLSIIIMNYIILNVNNNIITNVIIDIIIKIIIIITVNIIFLFFHKILSWLLILIILLIIILIIF